MATNWPTMESRGPVVTDADVAAFEKHIGHSLPEDYRRFLIEVNGGTLDTESNGYKYTVSLLSLNDPDESNDLFSWDLREQKVWLRPSPDLLHIGYDLGAPIMIAIAGERRGEVWLERTWDPRPEGSNPRVLWFDRRDMKKLADSFEQFMGSLKPLR